MTPTNPQQEAQTSEAPASKSAIEVRGLVSEQQIQDAAGVIDEQFDDILEVLKKTVPVLQAAQRKALLDEVMAVIANSEHGQ